MKNYHSKKFTNELKLFYEDKQKQKDNQIRSIIFLYIFNNLEEFCNLIRKMLEENNTREKELLLFYLRDAGWTLSKNPFKLDEDSLNLFFYNLKNLNYTNYNNYLKEEIIYNFYNSMSTDSLEEDAINVILKELKINKYFLNNFQKNMDVDLYFDLCIKYSKLRKYCPNFLEKDLYNILEVLKN